MEYLLYTLLLSSLILTFLVTIKTRDLFSPAILSFLFWCLPIFFASLRLSGLQGDYWVDKTYLLLSYSIIAFNIIPAYIILLKKIKIRMVSYKEVLRFSGILNTKLVIILAFVTFLFYFSENYLAAGTLFPLTLLGSQANVHTVSISGLLIVTRSFIPVISILLYLVFLKERKKVYLFLLLLILLLPVTRLARFDIIMSLIPLGGIIYASAVNKKKFLISSIAILFLTILIGSAIGEFRMTLNYTYDISYAEGIKYNGVAGPFDMFAVLYGYFSLSVENLDRFIQANYDFNDYQYGAFVFRPIMAGLLKYNSIFQDYPMYNYINALRDPLIGYATVHTALVDFSMDLGYYFSFIIMLGYSIIALLLYLQSNRIYYYIIYLIYVQSFAFLAFQNLFIESRLMYQIILFIFIYNFSIRKFRNIKEG